MGVVSPMLLGIGFHVCLHAEENCRSFVGHSIVCKQWSYVCVRLWENGGFLVRRRSVVGILKSVLCTFESVRSVT